jgi:hypothetical protein
MPCVVKQDGDIWVIDTDHPSYPRQKAGLGDKVEAVLTAIGITERRISRVIGRPCGCSDRKKLLNQLGEAVTRSGQART